MVKVEVKPEHTGYLSGKQNGPILVQRKVWKFGDIFAIECQEKYYPVRPSGQIWITCGTAITWYVVDSENLIGKSSTYQEARQVCLDACDDGRKYPGIKRLKPGLYEYNQSSRYSTDRRANFYIGTKSTLLQAGFDESLFN